MCPYFPYSDGNDTAHADFVRNASYHAVAVSLPRTVPVSTLIDLVGKNNYIDESKHHVYKNETAATHYERQLKYCPLLPAAASSEEPINSELDDHLSSEKRNIIARALDRWQHLGRFTAKQPRLPRLPRLIDVSHPSRVYSPPPRNSMPTIALRVFDRIEWIVARIVSSGLYFICKNTKEHIVAADYAARRNSMRNCVTLARHSTLHRRSFVKDSPDRSRRVALSRAKAFLDASFGRAV